MTFLNPLVLLGLVAAGIPLIIHLFNFRKPKRVDFSSLTFVKELEKTTMRRVRIKQWLLLVLRTLAIACLVLAFARPTVTGNVATLMGGDVRSTVGLIVDNSLSMSLRDRRGELLAQAKEIASAVVDEMKAGDDFLIQVTSGPSSINSVEFSNKASATDYISRITAENGSTETVPLVRGMADRLAQAANLNKELYLITDAQKSTFGDSALVEIPADVRVSVIPVGEMRRGNVGITRVSVDSRIIEVGQPIKVSADVANFGSDGVDSYAASVFLDGQRVAQASAPLEALRTATLDFVVTPSKRGWLAGVVRGEDDDFPSDNERHFALHVPERRSVLVVQGDGQTTEYVTLAMSPTIGRDGVVFDYKVIGERELPAERVDDFDAVVLVGLNSISSGEVATMSRYVGQGGGLLVFPGNPLDANEYNALLSALGGGRVVGFVGRPGNATPATRVERFEVEHTLFDGVFDRESLRQQRDIEKPEVFFAVNYAPSQGSEQTLIAMGTGSPFLQEMRHGEGATLLLSVAPDPAWSTFPVRGLFVPLLYRSIFYLSASEAAAGEQLLVGRANEIRVTGVPRDASLTLVGPDGEDFVPEQRNLFGAVLLSAGEQITRAGVYDVRSGGELVRRVAFNLDDSESDLAVYEPAEAARRLEESVGQPVARFELSGSGREAVTAAINTVRTGVELWNVFIMVALLFLVGEMVVEKHWRPEAAPA